MNKKKARVIAFYLPQYHPIPENDEWWGKGFTEWTNVAKAKPLFKGHLQPRIPADLGFYDLRMPEIKEQQAQMAREAGVEGFCYWHYWFGNGKMLLEKPFKEVLDNGKPDFPFCLGWANHDWTNKTWKNAKSFTNQHMLQQQSYPGKDDYVQHFNYVLDAFKDKRYIHVDDKPLFVVFAPHDIPNVSEFISLWNSLAVQNGLKGIHFVGIVHNNPSFLEDGTGFSLKGENDLIFNKYNKILEQGFNAVNSRGYLRAQMISKGVVSHYLHKKMNQLFNFGLKKYSYNKLIRHMFTKEDSLNNVYPTIIPNYDRSPRSGKNADVWHGSTPSLFKKHVGNALRLVENKEEDHKIIFLKSWNEWGETNYMEPDLHFGKEYLEVLKECLIDK